MIIIKAKTLNLGYKINRKRMAAGQRRLMPWQGKRQQANRKGHSGHVQQKRQ
jgi:hypothetical protein